MAATTPQENTLVQIIDKDGKFIEKKEIDKIIEGWNFKNKGYQWYVVAILGCQSSGKSTLLNLLFGTVFPVMVQNRGRSQTTQGVWMAMSQSQQGNKDNVVVFDVEGVDSRERGEHHLAFERKTSLFSLALSEILLINMWHHDIGRYNAGNISLLKSVFELNLQLFQRAPTGAHTSKTLLLFVIRDHVPAESPLSALEEMIENDMKDIWKEIQKPKQFTNSSIKDFFDFQFIGLPARPFFPEQFTKDVNRLRERFINPTDPEYILAPNYKKDIPADGFTTFATNIWNVIQDNKDLDLPTQREMLAIYRCDDIIDQLVSKFTSDLKDTKQTLENGEFVRGFGETLQKMTDAAITEFDSSSQWYDSAIVNSKRAALVSKLAASVSPLFVAQLKIIAENSLAKFNDTADTVFAASTASDDFATELEKATNLAIDLFKTQAQDSVVRSFSEWTFEKELKELEKSIEKRAAHYREKEIEKLETELKNTLSAQIDKTVQKTESTEVSKIWQTIRQSFETEKAQLKEKLLLRLKGFRLSADDERAKVEQVDTISFETLKKTLREKNKYLKFTMVKRFDRQFTKDEDGLPRRWKPEDNVKEFFMKAKVAGEEVLEQFSLMRLKDSDDSIKYLDLQSKENPDVNHILLTRDEAEHIKAEYEKDAESSYMQAVRDQEGVSTTAQIPAFMWVLLVVLGFNEFVAIISSPLLLILTILLVIGGYVVYVLGLSGPVQQILVALVKTTLSTVNGLVHQGIQQYNQHQAAQRPAGADTSSTASKKKRD